MRRLVASWFWTGLVPGRVRGSDNGAGTFAAAVTLLLSFGLHAVGGWRVQLLAALAVAACGVWASSRYTWDDPGSFPNVVPTKHGDPGWVVVDEAAGTLVATVGLGAGLPALVAFAVFRAADILKRVFPGVSIAERYLPSGWGVMGDDVVAGLYGLAAGWITTSAL